MVGPPVLQVAGFPEEVARVEVGPPEEIPVEEALEVAVEGALAGAEHREIGDERSSEI